MDGIKSLIEKLKARLFYSETNGGEYNPKRPKSTGALGKYQFVPSHHWNDIRKFAKQSGYGDNITEDEFLQSPDLQDEFFAKYVKDTVIPGIRPLMKDNKRNLDVDEVMQLYHMRPGSVKQYISGGKWEIPNQKNNSSLDIYLTQGKRGLEAAGLNPASEKDLMSDEDVRSNVNNYFKKANELKTRYDNKKLSEGAFKQENRKLQKEYASQGFTKDINNELLRKQADGTNAYNSKRQDFKEFYKTLYDPSDDTDSSLGIRKSYDPKTKRLTLKGDGTQIRLLAEKLGLRQDKRTDKVGATGDTRTKILNSITFDMTGKGPNSRLLVEGINKYSEQDRPITIDDLAKAEGLGEQHAFDDSNSLNVAFDFSKKYEDGTNVFEINPDLITSRKTKDYGTSDTNKDTTDTTTASTNEDGEETTVATKAEEELVTVEDVLSYMDETPVMDKADYDKKDFKQEIPWDAAVQGVIGLMGMDAADNEIPMRDERISAGMEDYIDKISELSRIGLPPELEAQAKGDLADAYQLGLENIVRASSGNRNLVLGNQSQLDLAKMKGNQQILVEDFKAKVSALNSYGEAMKYVNEFDTRRDIANKRLEQDIALGDREAGGELANVGFGNMMKSIQNQKERAPGTPYHQLMSQMQMDAFGYIPGKKDDGSIGSKSYFLDQQNAINENNTATQNLRAVVPSFKNDQAKLDLMKDVSQRTGNRQEQSQIADLLINNDASSINMDKFQTAQETGDFSSLLEQEEQADNTSFGFSGGFR